VSGIARQRFLRVEPVKPVYMNELLKNKNRMTAGLQYTYYEGSWDSIPDFTKLPSTNKGIANGFSLDGKMKDELYGIRFQGVIIIPETDIYTFYTSSDDGSNLYIDGQKVVDNDGLHGKQEKKGHIALEKGFHRITVDYFQKTGSDDLDVSWSSDEIKKDDIPDDILFY
jgi:hypothetical protein